jgi:hypothetical protein
LNSPECYSGDESILLSGTLKGFNDNHIRNYPFNLRHSYSIAHSLGRSANDFRAGANPFDQGAYTYLIGT